MQALIKNNEAAIIVAQAILPMLFVFIDRKCRDRKCLLLTGFQNVAANDPTTNVPASTVPKSVSPRVVLLPLMWAVGA